MKYLTNKVNSIYFDVLKEVGNIGTGSATTSMSVILNTKLSMHMPDARLISIQDLNTIIGSEEEEVVAIYLQIHNGIDGSLMFLLKKNAAYFLLNRLLGKNLIMRNLLMKWICPPLKKWEILLLILI